MALKPNFPLHPDTAFMLAPPQMTVPVPKPTVEYELYSKLPNERVEKPRPLLLILDLNGTLLHRPRRNASAHFTRRACLNDFLVFSFSAAKVMIWTTAQPGNARLMRDNMLTAAQAQELVATWDRGRFGLGKQLYREKTIVYKRLEWVWEDAGIQATHPNFAGGERWDQTNTVLLDDSAIKAKAQPYNHILVPEFEGHASDRDVKNGVVLEQVAGYVEEARHQTNVSAWIKQNPFKVDEKIRPVRFGPGRTQGTSS